MQEPDGGSEEPQVVDAVVPLGKLDGVIVIPVAVSTPVFVMMICLGFPDRAALDTSFTESVNVAVAFSVALLAELSWSFDCTPRVVSVA